MHKDVSIGHNYQSLITSHIQSIKQQSKVHILLSNIITQIRSINHIKSR